jgi:hypothetical protein
MKNYELKRSTLLIKQESACPVCHKRFTSPDEIELAHKLRTDVPNNKLFGKSVIDHVLNLAATHKNCNSAVLINRATDPVKAHEHVVDILSAILLDDPLVFEYKTLMKAFDNIDYNYIVNIVSISQYEILDNFFKHYRDL